MAVNRKTQDVLDNTPSVTVQSSHLCLSNDVDPHWVEKEGWRSAEVRLLTMFQKVTKA